MPEHRNTVPCLFHGDLLFQDPVGQFPDLSLKLADTGEKRAQFLYELGELFSYFCGESCSLLF
jgi:hypothetical protein